jgi:AcrR family transcriptional regulator
MVKKYTAKSASDRERSYHHGDLRQALIDAALELLAEEQNWLFSLREVARRAGVSHNAPYNHFSDKGQLLAAVAAVGFTVLRDRMVAAIRNEPRPDAALVKSGVAYLRFGLLNPAQYRLMFGPTLGPRETDRPADVIRAAEEAKGVLRQVIERGAGSGVFPGLAGDPNRLAVAALAAWSTVHGLTMAIIDGLVVGVPQRAIPAVVEAVAQTLTDGLTHPSRKE